MCEEDIRPLIREYKLLLKKKNKKGLSQKEEARLQEIPEVVRSSHYEICSR